MKIKIVLAILLLALAGCRTTDQMLTTAGQYLNASYVGHPLSDFIFRNGMTPYDAFDMPDNRRVFMFKMPCVSWWHTRRVDAERTPASYIVERIEIRGYCDTGSAH